MSARVVWLVERGDGSLVNGQPRQEAAVNHAAILTRASPHTGPHRAVRFIEQVSEWQPIETAPKDGTRVLVLCPAPDMVYVAHWDAFDSFGDLEEGQPTGRWSHGFETPADPHGEVWPTLWMPIPAAPAGGTT